MRNANTLNSHPAGKPLAVALLLFGLFAALPLAQQANTLVWPLPPEQPRIRYVREYMSAADFQQKRTGWKALLFGPEEPTRIDRLVKPYGIAVDRLGRVYVADTVARRIFVFDQKNRKVEFVGERAQVKPTKPIGVAVDAEGTVFVADATVNRVFGYSPDGALAIAIGADGEFENPSGLAVDPQAALLYVADAQKHVVRCYSSRDGTFVREIGRRGSEPGQFNFPTNVFVDRESQLYVADTLNFRIQIFDPQGRFLKAFGKAGDSPGSLYRPKGVAVDSEGHIYVADTSFNNFQVFDREGTLLLFVGGPGRDPGQFLMPTGLFIDGQDRVYVADQGNGRVQVFQYLAAGGR